MLLNINQYNSYNIYCFIGLINKFLGIKFKFGSDYK